MRSIPAKSLERAGAVLACALPLLFCFSVFKNISYPLLWSDEAHTAVFAGRVTRYGYPKVHDGKNIPYQDLIVDGKLLSVDEKTDAELEGGWAMFYVGALGVLWGRGCDDLYRQTARIRIPFALIGIAGVGLLGFSFALLVPAGSPRRTFWILFWLQSLLSVSLALHLREARHYSLVVFEGAALLGSYVHFRFTRRLGWRAYLAVVFFSLLTLFQTIVPAFVVTVAALAASEAFLLVEGGLTRESLRSAALALAPVAFALALLAPFAAFFKLAAIIAADSKFMRDTGPSLVSNFFVIARFFLTSESLGLLLVLKACSAAVFVAGGRRIPAPLRALMRVSTFLAFYSALFVVSMLRVLPFTRYFVLLLPLQYAIILMDGWILFQGLASVPGGRRARPLIAALAGGVFLVNSAFKIPDLRGHVYELFHQYRGPLDFAIPFIKSRYPDPSRLVIATNYEEFSYMFYLDSKVVFGFGGNNLAEDLAQRPDVVIPRVYWPITVMGASRHLMDAYLRKDRFEEIEFPITDTPTNNIPELMVRPTFHHFYRTPTAGPGSPRFALFLRAP